MQQVVQPRSRDALPAFSPGDAFLAGGTWLFSEPQAQLRRLVDLTSLGWPALERGDDRLLIAATCTLAELDSFEAPALWRAASLFGPCCRMLLGSFKIRRLATVGGNLCLALPAAPMAALAVALHATCLVWRADGGERRVAAADFFSGAGRTILGAGDILRALELPAEILARRAAMRQASLTTLGRSAVLLIGTRLEDGFELTIAAATPTPRRILFAGKPSQETLAARIDEAVPVWYDDIHGRPAWRRRMTHRLAAELCLALMVP